MPDTLPDYVASLSKYIDAHDHYKLLADITRVTPSEDIRTKFGDKLYATAKARYLTVEDGVVLRDKLIDLVHEEGSFTERVRMAMYISSSASATADIAHSLPEQLVKKEGGTHQRKRRQPI